MTGPQSDAPVPTAPAGPAAVPTAPYTAEAETASRYVGLNAHDRSRLTETFVATDPDLGRDVALKTLQPQFADQPDSQDRFYHEAEVVARLEHPGVVPVHALGRHADGRPCVAMRLAHGESIAEAVRSFHTSVPAPTAGLAFRRLLQRFVQVCQTVAYAHNRRVIHGDIKPTNILLGSFGETVLVGWGATGTVEPATGSAVFLSPEQVSGEGSAVGPPADVYGLGATLYHLLTGKSPFVVASWPATQKRIQEGDAPPPRTVNRGVPPALEAICRKAMAAKSGDRYRSALELANDLERWLADEPVAAFPESLTARAARQVGRRRGPTAVLAVVAFLAVVTLGGWLLASQYQRHVVTAERDAALAQRDAAVKQRREARGRLDVLSDVVAVDLLGGQAEIRPRYRALLQEMLAWYVAFAAEPGEGESDRHTAADGYRRAALIRERLGDPAGAESDFHHATEGYEKLVAEFPNKADYRLAAAHGHGALARLAVAAGRPDGAKADYQRARQLFEDLARENPQLPEYRRQLALTTASLAALGGPAEQQQTIDTYRLAVGMLAKLVDERPNAADYRKDLAQTEMDLATHLWQIRDLPRSEAVYRLALKAVATLGSDPAGRRLAGAVHNNLGGLLAQKPDFTAADAEFQQAADLYGKLAAEFPSIIDFRREEARARANRGFALSALNKTAEAVREYEAALALREQLLAAQPGVGSNVKEVIGTANDLGRLAREAGKPADALPRYDRSVKVIEKLPADAVDRLTTPGDRASAYLGRARALAGVGRAAEAVSDWERGLATATALGADAPNFYNAACAASVAAGALKADPSSAERFASRAVDLLKQARAKGYFKDRTALDHLKSDADLAAVRDRPDFRAFLADVEAATP
jgi:tetratricopeptide (TPR) repeat protein